VRANYAILVLFLLVGLGCSEPPPKPDTAQAQALAVLVPGSGVYSRPITTESSAAQQFFDQGLRLAWGFYFPESIASYQEAARLDPTHPMPYWGMAHAMGPNPNSRYGRMPDDPLGEGLKAIEKARSLADNGNDYERDLINAMYVLYDQKTIADDGERDLAYLDAARALHKKYPTDADVGALYAAGYMSIGRWDYWDANGEPKSETATVAAALEQVLVAEPGHPGANHLYIHLLEASLEPERALGAADRLEATMPVAGHVVHMPAHIYVRVGQYQKAIASNERSQEVDLEFARHWGDLPLPNLGTYPLSHKMHAPHAIDFIRYAATVQGNYAVAIEAAEKSAGFVSEANVDKRGGQKRASAPWLVHKTFGKWDKLITHTPRYVGLPYLDGIWSYALGGAYAATGDLVNARLESDKLTKLANSPDADTYRVGATPASAVLKLASLGLQGEILQAEGRFDEAIAAFAEAVAIEDQNNYTEPPDWSQPVRHFLGAALVEAGQYEQAEAVYRRDLRWNQNNGWSLYGLYQSLDKQGKEAEAASVYQQYEQAWQHADVTLTRSRI
jgi:tetratricopeptide (TPR) repeat protein